MRTKFIVSPIILIILALWLIPNKGWSQLPIRVKRSNELTRSAFQAFKEQKVDQAKEQLNQAIRLNPKNVVAHELLALLFYQEHNFQKAKKHAKIAIELNQNSSRALYVLGMMSFQQGDHDLARTQLRTAIASLKDAEYRQRAKNILEKLKANIPEKPPAIDRTDITLKDEPVTQQPVQEQEYKPFIAVFPFEDTNARTEQSKLGQTLTEMLITAFIQTDKFNVMERVQLEKLLKEQSLSQTGAIDTETAVEVGRLSGLEGVIVGSISQLKSAIEADARLIDVETGKALTAANANVNSVDSMRGLASSLAQQLSAKAYLIAPAPDTTKANNYQ